LAGISLKLFDHRPHRVCCQRRTLTQIFYNLHLIGLAGKIDASVRRYCEKYQDKRQCTINTMAVRANNGGPIGVSNDLRVRMPLERKEC
jgi:hypothetical protein